MNLKQALVYLPQDRRQAIACGADLPDRTRGVALFADVSGFTPLAEALVSGYGTRRGAEALLRQLDQLFEALIAQVDDCGGTVISFEGDAITCWFDESGAEYGAAAQPVCQRALACAVQMEKAMQAFSQIQIPGQAPVSLALKVSAAYGPARRFVVGDPAIQCIDTLAGKTLERMAAAQALAERGEVIVDEETARGWPVLERRVHPENGETYCAIDLGAPAFADFAIAQPRPVEDWADAGHPAIQEYVLPAIWERIEAGMGELMTELRPAAALFLSFSGIDYDNDEQAGVKLDAFIRRAQAIMHAYDGTLLQLSIGDKGSYFYASFGAPVAHEDDMHRAVRAAMELRAAVEVQSGQAQFHRAALAPVRIGISHGVMHTGSYGSSTRRTYGVIGDDVNTAARLMSKAAPGEILVTGRIRNAASEEISFEPRTPVFLKGKAEPLPVFAATGAITRQALRLEEPTYALPMIGRKAELEVFEERLERAAGGAGQVIGIRGDPGMGKSRLAAEAIRLARRQGFTGYGGACQSASASYQVWKTIWQGFFGIDTAAPLRRLLRNLEGEIEDRAPERVDAMPLLGPVLGLALPENDFTAALDPQARKSALEALLLDCLAYEAQQAAGLLFVLEDLHWIDPASLELLEALVTRIADLPVLVIAVYRPLGLRGNVTALSFSGQPNFTELVLGELGAEEAALAIHAKLAQLYPERSGAVPKELIERITRRAQGNPFYLEELLNYIHDRNVNLDDPSALSSLELPASLHSLVLSRIDQFSTRQQVTLKAASVIGRLFRYTHLSGYYPALMGGGQLLRKDLDVLAQFELTPLYSPEPELEYLFKHIVTREVAYETLPFATRSALHEQYAHFIEEEESERLAEADVPLALLDLLAYHFGRSEDTAKQIEYFRRAGDAAARAFANAAAVDYYKRLLPLLDESARQEVRLSLARVYRLTGDWDEGEAVLQEGLRTAELSGDRLIQARFSAALGDYSNKHGASEKALEWLVPAQVTLAELNAPADLSDALLYSGEARMALGQYPDALADFEKAQALARDVDDRPRLLRAMISASLLYYNTGEYSTSLLISQQAYDLAVALGNRRGMINPLNNIGMICIEQNQLIRALDALLKAYTAAFEIGNRVLMSITAGNIGHVYQEFGAHERALACYEHSLALSLQIGDSPGVAELLWNLSRLVDAMQGPDALEWVDSSVILTRALERPYELSEYMQTRAALLARAGRPVEAQAANAEARRAAEQVGRTVVLFRCAALEPSLRMALGEIGPQEAAEALRTLLNTWPGDDQQAELHYQIWKTDPECQDSRARAVELYTRLRECSDLHLYRARIREMTGVDLPAPALPPLPGSIPPARDLRPLLQKSRELIRKTA